MENTNIEWTDHTFNPWMGCTKVSPGCDHCYAERDMDHRLKRVQWGPQGERVRTKPANWRKPLAWDAAHAAFFERYGRRQRVFCASLADVFDNAVDPAWRRELFDLIELTPNLDWLLLTKRVGNVARMVREAKVGDWLAGRPNVWIGASIVNQEEANRDIIKLLELPAAVRFLSMEPLLGPVDLSRIDIDGHSEIYPLAGTTDREDDDGRPLPDLPALDWIIVGGESGPQARPMHPDWPRQLRNQCYTYGVPYLFKQWGEWTPQDPGETIREYDLAGVLPDGDAQLASQGYRAPFDSMERLRAADFVRLDGRKLMHRVGKKAAGRDLDGAQHDGYPK